MAIRILMVEDLETDAELAKRELARAGLKVEMQRVEREEEFRGALARFLPQVILSDFSMPYFDGMAALKIARESVPDIPFIFVSGTLGEEYAIRALRDGATDYVLKSNLVRLPPAVQRALQDTQVRTAARRAAEDLSRFRLAMDNSADMVLLIDRATMRFVDVNASACRLLGYSREEMLAMGPEAVLPVTRAELEKSYDAMIAQPSQAGGMNSFYRCKDGSQLPFESTRCVMRSGDSAIIVAVSRDIRARIAAEEALRASEAGVRRLNRVYAMLSGINALIVRVRERVDLFREACRLAVEVGSFACAWIGVVDRAAMRVVPIASQGMGRQYMDLLPLDLKEGAPGYSLAGETVNARGPTVVDDLATDPRIVLRAEAGALGLHSLVMLPLVADGEVAGVLALYATEIGFFDDAEMKLLRELADDISFALEHIKKTEAVEYLSSYDPLTGLANRALFIDRLQQSIGAAAREQRKMALAVLDIERFKTINDSLGRRAGDSLLTQLAERLVGLAAADPRRVAHLGADRFAVIIPDAKTDAQVARIIEQGVARTESEPFEVAGTELRIAVKAGIAMFPSDAAEADALFRNAEAALKKAKAGGERYLFYTQQMTERVAERLVLENRLRRAVEREEFVLYYQPKTDLERRRILGIEALIRWQSPELGLVAPLSFIPLLEETGLILQVGAWALRRAGLDQRRWAEEGIAPPRVAVNVSAIQLRQRNFVSLLEESIAGNAAPGGLELEITESLIMDDIEGNIEKLNAARKLGIGVAIDDFGTGYSSLAYLARLPVETLKIDRSFITGMIADANTATLVRTIVSMAHSLKLRVVAEGVETEAQVKALAGFGCDQMQGYLFSKPVPAPEMSKLLRAHRAPT